MNNRDVPCRLLTRNIFLATGLWWGCHIPPAEPDVTPEVVLDTPQIESYELSCIPEDELWQIDVEVTYWSSGAIFSWTDGQWLEQHTVRSVSASPDGQGDTLRLRLEMVLDPTYQSPGSTTIFRCPDSPTAQLDLYNLDGNRVDCVRWGPNPELLDTDGISRCDS